MTQAITFSRHGGPEVMELQEQKIGAPGQGEVQIRQTAIGVNYLDVYIRRGDFGSMPMPNDTGFEAAGVVEAVGPGVTSFAEDDRVAYQLVKGAYAERRKLSTDRLVKLPDSISDEVAAAALLKGTTAEYLLNRFRKVGPCSTILVHAASGGVGSILTQWAKHLGATVIGTVGSEEKAKGALARGVDHAIVYTHEDFVPRVLELTDNAGVDIVYDGVGLATFARNFDCLSTFGTNTLFGWASGKVDPVDVHALNGKSQEVANPSLGHYTGTPKQLQASAAALFEVISSGAVKVGVSQRYSLAEADKAHRDLEQRRTTGSVVLIP